MVFPIRLTRIFFPSVRKYQVLYGWCARHYSFASHSVCVIFDVQILNRFTCTNMFVVFNDFCRVTFRWLRNNFRVFFCCRSFASLYDSVVFLAHSLFIWFYLVIFSVPRQYIIFHLISASLHFEPVVKCKLTIAFVCELNCAHWKAEMAEQLSKYFSIWFDLIKNSNWTTQFIAFFRRLLRMPFGNSKQLYSRQGLETPTFFQKLIGDTNFWPNCMVSKGSFRIVHAWFWAIYPVCSCASPQFIWFIFIGS